LSGFLLFISKILNKQIIAFYKVINAGTYTSVEFGVSYAESQLAVFTSATNVTAMTFVVSEHNKTDNHIKGIFDITYNRNGSSHFATGTFDVNYIEY
jgi:hypothetical protein